MSPPKGESGAFHPSKSRSRRWRQRDAEVAAIEEPSRGQPEVPLQKLFGVQKNHWKRGSFAWRGGGPIRFLQQVSRLLLLSNCSSWLTFFWTAKKSGFCGRVSAAPRGRGHSGSGSRTAPLSFSLRWGARPAFWDVQRPHAWLDTGWAPALLHRQPAPAWRRLTRNGPLRAVRIPSAPPNGAFPEPFSVHLSHRPREEPGFLRLTLALIKSATLRDTVIEAARFTWHIAS